MVLMVFYLLEDFSQCFWGHQLLQCQDTKTHIKWYRIINTSFSSQMISAKIMVEADNVIM